MSNRAKNELRQLMRDGLATCLDHIGDVVPMMSAAVRVEFWQHVKHGELTILDRLIDLV